MSTDAAAPLFGVLTGGAGSRMGGVAKGLLPAPDTGEPIALRLARICREAVPGARVVLVGVRPEYAGLGLETLADDPAGVGPLGGLRSLLLEGVRAGAPSVVALACDLPFVTTEMVRSVGRHAPSAAAVAPHVDGKWQPLFARYQPSRVEPLVTAQLAGGHRSLWSVLDALGEAAVALPLAPPERALLRDWDDPEDR